MDGQELPARGGHTGDPPKQSASGFVGLATNSPQADFDEYGAELGQDAKVWKTYVKEADGIDMELVDGWNKSLDVTLIFAALFSAICTAFLLESSKRLEEDPAEISAQNLGLISQTLLSIANGSQLSSNSISNVPTNGFAPSRTDVLINALWFLSLALSVAVSLVAMLAKEWCYIFMSSRTGQPYSQAMRRQQRWEGLVHWKMPQMLVFLPSLIHLALLLFAIGLCIRLLDVHLGVAIPVLIVTAGAVFVYAASSILPLIYEGCPYSSAFSRSVKAFLTALEPKNGNRGDDIVEESQIGSRALAWMIETCENPRSVDVALQAIAGATPGFPTQPLEKSEANKMICKRLTAGSSYATNYERIFELYARALAFLRSTPSDSAATIDQASELRRKIRNLQMNTEKEVANILTAEEFTPSKDNLIALRTGSTTASYCLQALSHGTQIHKQTIQLIDSAIELLEKHERDQITLHPAARLSLVIGTAMLLSCAVAHADPPAAARIAMRLIPKQGRMGKESLGLLLAAFAFSRADQPGGTLPPPLTPAARAERAIELITAHGAKPESLPTKSTEALITLGLLELFSNSESYKLVDEDVEAIGSAFNPPQPTAIRIHTLPKDFLIHPYVTNLLIPSPSAIDKLSKIFNNKALADAYVLILNGTYNCIPSEHEHIFPFVAAYIHQQPASSPPPNAAQELISSLPLPLRLSCNDPNQKCDSVLDLTRSIVGFLENFSCSRITKPEAHLKLGLGTALLILHLFSHDDAPTTARLLLRLASFQGMCDKCFGLILMTFAILKGNYPYLIPPGQASAEVRTSWIIASMSLYAELGSTHDNTVSSMRTLGLLELLTNFEIYNLSHEDLGNISSALIRYPNRRAGAFETLTTLPPTFDTLQHTLDAWANPSATNNLCIALENEPIANAYIVALNYLYFETPSSPVELHAFAVAYIYQQAALGRTCPPAEELISKLPLSSQPNELAEPHDTVLKLAGSIADSLVKHGCKPGHISNSEIHFALAAKSAALLSYLFVHSDPPSAARLLLRLISTREICASCLGLLLVAFGFSRGEYPGSTHSDPPRAVDSTERVVQIIQDYVTTPTNLTEDTLKTMKALGLLELLSKSDLYSLADADFKIMSLAFTSLLGITPHTISTLEPGFNISRYALDVIAHNLGQLGDEPHGLFTDDRRSSALTHLVVLHHTYIPLIAGPPPESVYTFVLEWVCQAPPDAYILTLALNLLDRFPVPLPSEVLASTFNKRNVISLLENIRDSCSLDQRLFTRGQMYLIAMAAAQWLDSPSDAWQELQIVMFGIREGGDPPSEGELRLCVKILAAEYREMFGYHTPYLHSYFNKLLKTIDDPLALVN